MKHAYLILAHHEFALLQTLIDCLDDERNDIYVHIDKKVKTLPPLHARKSGFYFTEQRVDVRWGDLSMVKAEYVLFESAMAKGPYAYYHLLSGVDLPLRSQDRIHAFFEEHAGKEYIGYTELEMSPELSQKMQRWSLFPRHFSRKRNGYSLLRGAFIRLQKVLGIKRNQEIPFKKGSQWASVSEDFVRYVISRKDWVMKTFSHTFVPDECFLQTLCWMSPFREKLYDLTSDGAGCLRAIGWNQGELTDWSARDYDALAGSPALFARKFNCSDPAFIDRMVQLAQR